MSDARINHRFYVCALYKHFVRPCSLIHRPDTPFAELVKILPPLTHEITPSRKPGATPKRHVTYTVVLPSSFVTELNAASFPPKISPPKALNVFSIASTQPFIVKVDLLLKK